MPCYSPITGYRTRVPNSNGKYPITFNKREGFSDLEIQVPCGQCIGCRLEHARQWAIRCMHEAKMHEDNCFLTLTYEDRHLPTIGGHPTLRKTDLQKFMKRLRKKFGAGIKFYGAGEYGEQGGRPHYHICVFGFDFSDKIHVATCNGHKLYESETLKKLWPFGHSTIGSVTFDSAGYVARYCVKKWKGKDWQKHYERVVPETGEIISIEPEKALMSRKPPIGYAFLEKYGKEIFENDSVINQGMEQKLPRSYDRKLEKTDAEKYLETKMARRAAAKKAVENNSLARLYTRGKCKEAQIKQLKKEL